LLEKALPECMLHTMALSMFSKAAHVLVKINVQRRF
jgi:hypothetical protein